MVKKGEGDITGFPDTITGSRCLDPNRNQETLQLSNEGYARQCVIMNASDTEGRVKGV